MRYSYPEKVRLDALSASFFFLINEYTFVFIVIWILLSSHTWVHVHSRLSKSIALQLLCGPRLLYDFQFLYCPQSPGWSSKTSCVTLKKKSWDEKLPSSSCYEILLPVLLTLDQYIYRVFFLTLLSF